MAKQRKVQFYRNPTVTAYEDYQSALNGVKTMFDQVKGDLGDGEFILGRYVFPNTGDESERKHGVVVGVARRSGNTVSLDFLADENYVSYAIGSGLSGLTVQGGDGVGVSSSASGGGTAYIVDVELGSSSVVGTTATYNTNAENLLVIATDGKLSISDTWDCGTY